jgi:hypothetical protein
MHKCTQSPLSLFKVAGKIKVMHPVNYRFGQ